MDALSNILRRLLPGGPIYVRITRQRLLARDVRYGKEVDLEPLVALTRDPEPKVAAIGAEARIVGPYDVVNPFDHPRSILSDFGAAEKLLQHAFFVLFEGRWLRPSPVVIIHPLEKVEGGLTALEHRALRELGVAAGARRVYVWEGRELIDSELSDGKFETLLNPAGAVRR